MTVVVVAVAAWLFVLALVFALLVMAKRADEDAARAVGSRVEALPGERSLAGFVADVQRQLAVERVVVIVVDPGDDGVGRIVACAGATGVAGRLVRLEQPQRAGISARAEEIALLGLGPEAIVRGWVVAHSPIVRRHGIAGVVAVGSRGLPFSGSELAALVDLASAAPARFRHERGRLRWRIGA